MRHANRQNIPDTGSGQPAGDRSAGPSKPRGTRAGRLARWGRRLPRAAAVVAGVGVLYLLASCIRLDRPNPAYPATDAQVRQAIEQMERTPASPPRPVVVLSGWRSPSLTGGMLADRLVALTGAEPDRVLSIAYPLGSDIRAIADTVAEKVAHAFGSRTDPATGQEWTEPVDVVAISMGGLVARAAWADPQAIGRKGSVRLDVRTLYTLGSPHQGARLAQWIRLDKASAQMRPGSAFLRTLDRATLNQPGSPSIVPYATLRDGWVGATRSAPPGQQPIWVPGRLVLSHHLIALDRRIQADLARRLRGEEPLAEPSAPPRD